MGGREQPGEQEDDRPHHRHGEEQLSGKQQLRDQRNGQQCYVASDSYPLVHAFECEQHERRRAEDEDRVQEAKRMSQFVGREAVEIAADDRRPLAVRYIEAQAVGRPGTVAGLRMVRTLNVTSGPKTAVSGLATRAAAGHSSRARG